MEERRESALAAQSRAKQERKLQEAIEIAWISRFGDDRIQPAKTTERMLILRLNDGQTIGTITTHKGIKLRNLPCVSVDKAARIVDILNEGCR